MRRRLVIRTIIVPAIYLAVVISMLKTPPARVRYISQQKTVVEVK